MSPRAWRVREESLALRRRIGDEPVAPLTALQFALLAFNDAQHWLVGDGGASSLVAGDRNGIARGERLLRDVEARGGTELFPALQRALSVIRGGGDVAGRVPVVVLITDGEVGDESRALALVQRAGIRVFTVGVDTSVNSGLLKRIAQAAGGTFVLTEPGAGLEEALEAIAREIGAPVVEGLSIAVDGGAVTDVAPERLPDLFAGRAATIAFRAERGSNVRVTGRRSDGALFTLDVSGSEVDLPAVAHLWARRRLTDLEDRYRLARGDQKPIEAEIVALSASHNVLSRFTAFLVVDDRQAVVSTADRRTIVQPVEAPHMWASRLAPGLTVEDATAFMAEDPGPMIRRSLPLEASAGVPRLAGGRAAPAAAQTRDEGRDLREPVDHLLKILREVSGGVGLRERYAEALRVVDQLLAVLAQGRRRRDLAELIRTLERLRQHLEAAAHAQLEAEAASRELSEALERASAALASRGRFWDTV